MTETSISLLSIVFGIVGANFVGIAFQKHSLGITGNTLTGVFGSVFFIKSFGKLGFDPTSLMETGQLNIKLLVLNISISMSAGALGVILASKVKRKLGEAKG